MPDYFAHRIFAENLYGRLPDEIKTRINSVERYLLGAQGCDLYFFYRLTPGAGNRMHGTDAMDLFTKLAEGDTSYLLGFCTHYALDSMFHPAVYRYAKVFYLRHAAIESDLGTFLSRVYGKEKEISAEGDDMKEAERVYESVKPVIRGVTLGKIEKTLRRFRRYETYLYRKRKDAYRCRYDFDSLKPLLSRTEDFCVKVMEAALNGETEGDLFSKSFKEGRPW
ncbi:MAG: zinc dependent phospholipase C family protein [Clostridia bacterium]|nr:zinc dependent phospholipase C family protein [Clostridia bacterium]